MKTKSLVFCACCFVGLFLSGCSSDDSPFFPNLPETTEKQLVDSSPEGQFMFISTEESSTEMPTQAQTSPAVKDLPEIQADLESKKKFGDNAIIDDLTIIKRQTQVENLIDTVFVTAEAHDENVKYVSSMKLSYGLYNEGWILDGIECYSEGENRAEPLKGPDVSIVDAYFESYNASLEPLLFKSIPPYSIWYTDDQNVDLAAGFADLHL